MSMLLVSDDILKHVFMFLEDNSLDALFASSTCKQWRRIADQVFGTNLHLLSLSSVLSNVHMRFAVDYWLPRHPLPGRLFASCVKICSLEDILFFYEKMNIFLTSGHFNTAALRGDLNILKWLHENGCRADQMTFLMAARSGKVECLQWLKDLGLDRVLGIYTYSAKSPNNKAVFTWILENFPSQESTNAVGNSLHDGCDLDFLKWMVEDAKFPVSEGLLDLTGNCSVEVVQYLLDIGQRPSNMTTTFVAEHGHLETLQYMIKSEFPVENRVLQLCVRFGHLDLVKVLILEKKLLLSASVFNIAAMNGQLKIMEWLLQNECPWDEDTFYFGIESGLEVMRWLYDNKCPVNKNTTIAGVLLTCSSSSFDKLKWLEEHELYMAGEAMDDKSLIPLPNNIDVAKWLVEVAKFNVTAVFSSAIRYGLTKVIDWMWTFFKHRIDRTKVYYPGQIENLDVYDWLKRNNFYCSKRQVPKVIWKNNQ